MRVEFFGLPGAGKSTLAAELCQYLAQAGTLAKHTMGPARQLRYLSAALRRFPVLANALVALAFSRRAISDKSRAARWILATLALYQDHHWGEGHRVLDEGLLQRALLLFWEPSKEVSSRSLARYVQAIPWPHFLIVVDAGGAETLDRLRGRGRLLPPRFQVLPRTDQLRELERGADLIEKIIAHLDHTVGRPAPIIIRLGNRHLDLSREAIRTFAVTYLAGSVTSSDRT